MRRAFGLVVAAGLASGAASADQVSPAAPAASHVRHSMRLKLDPAGHRLSLVDTLAVPAGAVVDGEAQFLLNRALAITRSEPAVRELPAAAEARSRFFGRDGTSELYDGGKLRRYAVALPAAGGSVRVEYEGAFDFGLSDQKEEYTRGFRETSGIVSPEGVYLAGSGFWYPSLGPALVECALEVEQPKGWQVIAPGNGTSRDEAGRARWDSQGPVDDLTVVGGPLVLYRDMAGRVQTSVYLRRKDDALAAKYLQAAGQYLEMYAGLIGPYPYGKFALVENFWETGYGMASFTLLGSQVIRFPFILTSSYPHEILHNWWGNSVFVGEEGGNWSEGLTAYMADHLLQEQRGRGDEYRRDALQRYRSYVREGRDFPLAQFRSRHSAATEAVGYAKAMMVFHMLRRRLDDDNFRAWARQFYREHRGHRASFADLRRTAEAVLEKDLGRFFADHVGKAGAARLAVVAQPVRPTAGGFSVRGLLKQTQPGPPLALDVPVVVQTAGKPVQATVHLDGASAAFSLKAPQRPLGLQVDPAFDVFRLLDPREIPPSVGQVFGSPRVLAVLPSGEGRAEQEAYRALVEGWRSESHAPEIRSDAEVHELPADRPVWLLGRTNRLAPKLFGSGGEYSVDESKLVAQGQSMPLARHSVVLVRRHPANLEQAVGWIFADGLAALPGLGRKLPHYGKYSYLGFEGDEPANVLAGRWNATDSPLRVDLRPAAARKTALAALVLTGRPALAELPAVFSQTALVEHVTWLSAPERQGRGIGTKGLDAAADYVASAFRAAGLAPGGDDATYFQSFRSERAPRGRAVTLRNVIGVLRGTKADWKGQSVVVGAHYDHLGSGWPDVHKGDEGRLHPGADDNASGVAVMLELAKTLATEKPQRTVVFVAFAGEEAGRLGSRHYAAHPAFPLEQTIGMVDLDTVGRLFRNPLSVIGTGTAAEWPHVARGAGFVTGVEPRLIAEALDSSDQKSFSDAGVPAVQLFAEAHADYHRPGDTADKIDGPGLVSVAAFAKEVVGYLGERPQPLTNTTGAAKGVAPTPAGVPAAAGTRRVSFGTMPDFAFAGPGVKVAGVTPGSPAEKAGVKEGDVLRSVDGRDVADLSGFSAILRGLRAGQTVRVVLDRAGRQQTLEVTVVER